MASLRGSDRKITWHFSALRRNNDSNVSSSYNYTTTTPSDINNTHIATDHRRIKIFLVTLLSSVCKVDISQMVMSPVSSSDTFKTASVLYRQWSKMRRSLH